MRRIGGIEEMSKKKFVRIKKRREKTFEVTKWRKYSLDFKKKAGKIV